MPARLYHKLAFGADGKPGASRTLVISRARDERSDPERAAEVRFMRFFDHTPMAIATVDRGGAVVRANARYAKLAQSVSGDAAAAKSIFRTVSQRDRHLLIAAINQAAEGQADIPPVEVMLGKIIPYVLVGFLQASIIIGIGVFLFGVPVMGSLLLLALLSTLFIATNLSIGYTFSTLAQNQLQAMQLSMMFFLPSILLSGFMFPFLGMPQWAQIVGECLPLTHYLRIVRAIMLKGSTLANLQHDTIALFGLMLFAMTVAVLRFRRTLD